MDGKNSRMASLSPKHTYAILPMGNIMETLHRDGEVWMAEVARQNSDNNT